MKPERTWIVILDASRARVLSSEGHGLTEVAGMSFDHHIPPAHELVDDRQSRSYESTGSARHAIDSGVDPRRKEKKRFVAEMAERLEGALTKKSFDRLVLVAPPQAMGDLRDAITPAVRQKVTHEIAKDLTKTPDHEIPKHLDLPFNV